jgi:hypothetical protein
MSNLHIQIEVHTNGLVLEVESLGCRFTFGVARESVDSLVKEIIVAQRFMNELQDEPQDDEHE